jgi:hypothetical protein
MAQQSSSGTAPKFDEKGSFEDQTRDNQEHELISEQETAAAMDTDLPSDADKQEETYDAPLKKGYG